MPPHGHHRGPFPGHRQGQAVGLLSPALACKGDWILGDGSQRKNPRGWTPEDGSQHTDLRALCSAAHPSCRTHSSLLLGMCSRPGRGSAKAAGSLQHLPCFCVPVAVVTLGQGSGLAWPWLVQRQPRAGHSCSKLSFLSNGCCNLGAPRGSFPSSFSPKNKGQQQGEPSPVQGVVPAPAPSWVRVARGAGPDAGAAHSRDAASAFHQAAGAVIDGLFIRFSPAQDVSVRLRKIFLVSASLSILPRLLLPPGSSLPGQVG